MKCFTQKGERGMTREERGHEVERWADLVWRLALVRTADIHDAEDVFQEVFLRYFRHEDEFADDGHRRAWLIRCTVNRVKSLHASPWRRRTLPLETAESVGVRDEYRQAYAAVLALPEKQRVAAHLHYCEGYSVQETAELLGCPEGTVKSRLARARELLRLELGKEEE